VVALEKSGQRKAQRWMRTEHIHSGEAEAIGLALQEHADWLLTDDAKAISNDQHGLVRCTDRYLVCLIKP
jgi:predicted nucleic acid-binding protein